MKKKHNPKLGPLGIVIAFLIVVAASIYIAGITDPSYIQPLVGENVTQDTNFKSYTSEALKVSFQYPKDWYIDDRYQKILLTNYQTNLNRDDHPNSNQIELLISLFSNCFKTIDEDLINPACGEGGSSKKSQILSKEIKQVPGGTFYKYLVRSANNNKLIFYFLQNGDKIFQISKQPDPSQFEKVLEDIINSIEFK